MTRWGREVTPANAHTSYPRPTMRRERWMNLNGLWSYQVVEGTSKEPRMSAGMILVPFPIESTLSGVAKPLEPTQTLRYWRTVTIPEDWKGQRVLMHIEACDWQARIEVNGRVAGDHTGGYDRFSADITDLLKAGENDFAVIVTDPTDTGGQPRGKQWMTPGGIWYTRTSGIWQTVWLEPVPETSISRVLVTPSAKDGSISVSAGITGPGDARMVVTVIDEGREVASGEGPAAGQLTVKVPSPKLWSPDHPHLYDVTVSLRQGTFTLDTVRGYFGLRDIALGKDASGVMRMMLNGEPVFQFGPLDQGFWPDGLYAAPSEEAMRFDIGAVKKMGCNMLRKHVKVEPEVYYEMCDRMGVMVWQDVPSPFFRSGKDWPLSPELSKRWRTNFEQECREIIADRAAHPSIVMWVPFNEGWGQNDMKFAASVVEKVKAWDPSRLVNNASGWTDMKIGDVIDIHAYPGPAAPATEAGRAAVLGEFGGLGLPVAGHTWVEKDNWGYVSYSSPSELTDAYVALIERVPALISQGLCAAVYTQTTDVEIECNGWLTYDREVWKVDPARAFAPTRKLYEPPPIIRTLVPTAREGTAREWRYTESEPAPGWAEEGFDDSSWSVGRAGFGTRATPGALCGTEWSTARIWLRSTFELGAIPERVGLLVHHDEDAEIYLNGVLVSTLRGYTQNYGAVALGDEARRALKVGTNTLAVRCSQTGGGQYIDCGLCEIIERGEKK